MQPYSDEIRAQVLAQLALGVSISALSREYHISRATISSWRQAAGLGDLAPIDQQKRQDLGELIAEYLRAGLAALAAQAVEAARPAWITRQPAGELAVFHGVLADKLVRILAALEGAGEEPLDAAAASGAPEGY
jgi:hypothetical protein